MKYILLFFSIMISHTAFAQLEKRLDSVINSSIQQGEPGLALYVEANGKTIYNKGFGMADTENKKTIGPNTNFRLASVSKQFTAMCVLLLEQDKKLSFEDPISRYLPELPQNIGNKVLIRHLITHTSGIIDYEEVMDNTISTPLLDIDVLNILKTQEKTYSIPGTEFRYSNSAYALMALIVERVSGQTFPQYMKERIFKPLKMKRSLVYEATAAIPNRSLGFARDKNMKLYANDQSTTSAIKGDGGVYTSLDDYKKWTHSLWKGTLLDLPSVLKRLNFSIKEVTGSYYGPGWFYFDKGNPALFHSGSTCGFSTYSVNIPGQKTSIVYFSNIAGNSEPFKKILEVLSTEGINSPSEVFSLHQLTR
ncbi:CubicO group peptidase, beta-lactamase class C family [Daejeonella rubra]|uniref:CubicO group peptidase, beta-lactamase class C family n=1 Tax=Daejeonella rubra TaxID=990371 RepID=A0A1G9M2V4_9SPHI|nr:serine hydrolase domain-containing protein [Daejeonella rubra]SDL68600.1 CubicO group peptidase, beta-lactamase class C family [Daejeonella rubra]